MKVLFIGRGKVARALQAQLRKTDHPSRLIPSRGRLPDLGDDVDLVVLCVRDDALDALIGRLVAQRPSRAAIVHVAGGRGPEVLSGLAGRCAGVARAHPLVSFASARVHPNLDGALWMINGDRVAVLRARRLARALGGVPRSWPGVAPASYHAAAALAANGTAALAAAATRVLVDAGAPPAEVLPAIAVLLRSVVENLQRLGLPGALTGPIRRGDAGAVAGHRAAMSSQSVEIQELYRWCGLAQLGLAHALGEAPPADLAAVERALRPKPRVRPRRNPATR